MADNTSDDIYDDTDTIGRVANDVNGATELPDEQKDNPSQSIFTPEKNTTDLDDRGPIDELEASDATDGDDLDKSVDPAILDDDPENFDGDSYHQGSGTGDERDGTEE